MLGIDPGSRHTGWGLLELRTDAVVYLDSGVWTLTAKTTSRAAGETVSGLASLRSEEAFAARLSLLSARLRELLERCTPHCAVLENVFSGLNARSALLLGHARGVILAELGQRAIPIFAFAPSAIKQAVTGYGRADKAQVQRMVRHHLGLDAQQRLRLDQSDALAIALAASTALQRAALEDAPAPG